MILRPYQQRSIDALYDWFRDNPVGHPCLVLPTGAGKSHIIAGLCKDAVQSYPETRILMVTHQKELIEQNAEKMMMHWPNAPLGIYSASIGRRDLGEPITFAGIGSIRERAAEIGHIDLAIVDEAHAINHAESGGYRKLLSGLAEINPGLRVIGLTATPYRLGHGLITDDPAIFDAIIEPVSIPELIYHGYLCMLRSKVTDQKLSTEGVRKRGGDYIESELQRAVDNEANNVGVVDEVIRLAGDRKSWLFFCSGVEHALHIRDKLRSRGVVAETVTGGTPKKQREQILHSFKAGEIQALTNANVLTTGFDAPNIDLIAMVRPTMSPGLYVQMAGRGLRICESKDDCLVLDFAGVVQMHGPITAVAPPSKSGEGEAPVKTCENCSEIVHLSAKECPACGHPFPPSEAEGSAKSFRLRRGDDIMGLESSSMTVSEWLWAEHTSRTSGKLMVKATYYGDLSDKPITEYFPLLHSGYAGTKAARAIMDIAARSGTVIADGACSSLSDLCATLNRAKPPSLIHYRMDGKFHRVVSRTWDEDESNEQRFATRAAVS